MTSVHRLIAPQVNCCWVYRVCLFLGSVSAGWGVGANAGVCMRYIVPTVGHCDSTGTCVSSCANVPAQTTVPHLACGVGCVQPNGCPRDVSVASIQLADACYTDGLRHGCQAGATCGASGTCVFSGDGGACTDLNQCAGLYCWKTNPMSSSGVCCNEECSGECQECSTGICLPRVGNKCSLSIPCDTVCVCLPFLVIHVFRCS